LNTFLYNFDLGNYPDLIVPGSDDVWWWKSRRKAAIEIRRDYRQAMKGAAA
jgi:hypothetical protein